jgi:UDP-N-acetyl-D-mannosaminuronic acid transferase (WecB/TagA/CpsF family)
MSGECEKCSEHCLDLTLEYELSEETQVMVKNIINMISYQSKDINEQFTILIHLLMSRLLSKKIKGIDLWDQVMEIMAKAKKIYYDLQ